MHNNGSRMEGKKKIVNEERDGSKVLDKDKNR